MMSSPIFILSNVMKMNIILVELSRNDDNFISWGRLKWIERFKGGRRNSLLTPIPCSFVLVYCTGAHVFHGSRSRLKILGAKSLHEASSVPRTPKYYHRTKFRCHGDLPHGICKPLA